MWASLYQIRERHMSEHSTPEERTELPTDKRMEKLRQEGQLHMCNEIPQVTGLLSGFMALYLVWGWLLEEMKYIIKKSFQMVGEGHELTVDLLYSGAFAVVALMGPPVAIIIGTVTIVAILSVMMQTNWNVKQKWIDPKISKLNPITGLKRIFSAQGVMNTLKAITKLSLILPVAAMALWGYAPDMVMLVHMSVEDVMIYAGVGVWELFWKIMYILLVLAAIDYFWTKFQWLKQNRMTKQEVKDERKSLEGDEQTKRKIQSKGLQRIAQRIRDSIPQADVVVTNPTHYAVALKYDRETMDAPVVLAKGRGFMALRIRELAKENKVPVMERKWLARSLYSSVEVGSSIPFELFRAVAEVLAYVYRLRGNGAAQQAARR